VNKETDSPTIVGLKALNRSGKVLISASDGSEHKYSAECIDAAGLGKGDALDEGLLARLELEQQRLTIHDAALHFLNHRDRSAKEVRMRLRKREFDDGLIEEEIERLERAGLLDDASFARVWVTDRVRLAPRSRRMLLHELAEKGISPEVAAEATKAIHDEDTALALAKRKAATLSARAPDDVKKKVMGFLTRKGYAYGLAASVASQVVDSAKADD
jgi:regulatory protein